MSNIENENYNRKSHDFLYKVVLIGDSGVGKSNLLSRFSRNEFDLDARSTIGVEFSTKNITIDDKIIKLQIWDTAGQERYDSITSVYYRGASGAILVYDTTKRETFNHINKWYKELANYTEKIRVILIGNKYDLKNLREISTEEGEKYAKENNIIFAETSALTSHNVHDAFIKIGEDIYRNKMKEQELLNNTDDDNLFDIKTNSIHNTNNRKYCPC